MPTIKDSSSIEEVLQYIVACYGTKIYQEKQRLSNLIADLYTGEERLKRLYRRMVMEDAVSQQLYAISLKPIQEREGFYNRLLYQFKEANFLEEAFARQSLDAFLNGMNLLLGEPISTVATEEDGEWVDKYGVKYSADRKKLIRAPENLYGDYRVLDGTIVICDGAFRWRDNLREITLPSSVTSIGKNAFYWCWHLQEINVTESNKAYSAIDGVLYTKDLKTIICYPQRKEDKKFVIPSSVTSIGFRAFSACSNLQEISIPPSVTSIGDGAFSGCSNLQEIKVVESNKIYKAIDGVLYTKDLKTIICYPKGKEDVKFTIPSNVTSIGDGAFSACSNLQKISIPPSVTSIRDGVFRGCRNLQEIKVVESNRIYKAIDGVLYTKDLRTLICYPGGKKDKKFVIPSSVTSIGFRAFSTCSNLQEINIPPSVTSIEDESFWACELQRINIPRGTLEKFKKLLPGWTDELHEI
jgi:hypothetical protein